MIAFGAGAAGASAQRVERDLRSPRPAAREGAGDGRAAARDDADPRRQRGVRARRTARFGLTTLRNRHVDVRRRGAALPRSAARAASAARRRACTTAGSRASSGAARSCPGRSCSSTSTTTASRADVDSADVNDYLREVTGEDFTAKDFRTWAGHGAGRAGAATSSTAFDSEAQAQEERWSDAIERSPQQLGNTPAVCRKCYVHPDVIDALPRRHARRRALAARPRGRARRPRAARGRGRGARSAAARLAREQRKRGRRAA